MKKIIHEIVDIGKGVYGVGYNQITKENLLKIYDDNIASISGNTSGTGEDVIEGHVIVDSANNQMLQQPNLKFNRMVVTNDNVNQQTIVSRPPMIVMGINPPLNPIQGDGWVNNQNWKTYYYYDGYWVEDRNIQSSNVSAYTQGFEMIELNSNEIKFDHLGGYIHGNLNPINGTLTFNFNNAIRGTIVNILYNDTTLTLPSFVKIISGYFSPSVDNYITMQLVDKTVLNEIIWASISQEL